MTRTRQTEPAPHQGGAAVRFYLQGRLIAEGEGATYADATKALEAALAEAQAEPQGHDVDRCHICGVALLAGGACVLCDGGAF